MNEVEQKEFYLHIAPDNYSALKAYEKQGYMKIAVTDKGRFRMVKTITEEKSCDYGRSGAPLDRLTQQIFHTVEIAEIIPYRQAKA